MEGVLVQTGLSWLLVGLERNTFEMNIKSENVGAARDRSGHLGQLLVL